MMVVKRRLKSEDELKNKRIQILMNSKEVEKLQELADKFELPISEYVRRATLGKIDFYAKKECSSESNGN